MSRLLDSMLDSLWDDREHLTRRVVCDDGIARPIANYREMLTEDREWLLTYRAVEGMNCLVFDEDWWDDSFWLPEGLPIDRDARWTT